MNWLAGCMQQQRTRLSHWRWALYCEYTADRTEIGRIVGLRAQFDYGRFIEPLKSEGPSPVNSMGATRSLFEHAARKLILKQHPNVLPKYGAAVTALILAGGTVAGTPGPFDCHRQTCIC